MATHSVDRTEKARIRAGGRSVSHITETHGQPMAPSNEERAPGDPAAEKLPVDRRVYGGMIAVLVITMLAFSVAPLANCLRGKKNKDYNLWYRTGRIVLEGGVLYPKDPRPFPFMYPPSCASMLAIASLGGEVPFVVGLVLVNSAAWLAAVLLAVYLATGRALWQHPMLYAIPSLCVVPFVHDMFLLGQPNLFLLALMLGAFACLRKKWPWIAGALIGVAAAVKAFPIMALAYLVYRRQWKATASVLISLVILLLVLPAGFRGPWRAWDDLATWTRGMVLKYDTDSIAQRPERSYSFKNQSMMALANRLLRPVLADGEADRRWKVNIADLDFRAVNAVIALVGAALCVHFLVSMPRRDRRTEETDAIEGAMLLLMILVFSPLSFNYFYVWLLYPLTMALRLILELPVHSRERAVLIGWLATSLVVFGLALPFLRAAQAYGNLFFTCVILMIGLGWQMRRIAATRRPLEGSQASLGSITS